MKSKKESFVYKPKLIRVVIENSIAFIALLILLSITSKDDNFFKWLLGTIIVFALAFVHNTYILKPAMQKQKWLGYLLKFILYLLIFCPFIFFLDYFFQYLIDKTPIPNFQENYIQSVLGSLIIIFIGGSIYLFKYYGIERQLRLKSELQLKKKQLLLLQSQINPHFLFNALNSIKALTISDPEKARDAIVSLSELLRKSLNTTSHIFIKIDEEITTVKEYLALEKIRYGDRLKFNIKIEHESKNALVPSMSLQLMVENAIKHGISRLMDGGKIDIHIYERDNKVHIDVRNAGQVRADIAETGIGIQNIIENLKLLYGDEGHFSLINENNQTVLAQLIIPIKYNQQ